MAALAPAEDRFVVRAGCGYSIGPRGSTGSRIPQTDFAVYDSLNCYREVNAGAFYAPRGKGLSEQARLKAAEALARSLNEWNRSAWPV